MIVRRGRLPVTFAGTIVDLETTGLSAGVDRVVTVGVLHGEAYEVFQSTDNSDLLRILKPGLEMLPRPFFAFNKGFEESFLGLNVDRDLQLRPYESRREAIRVAGVDDPFNGHGHEVPFEWRAYLADGKREHLERIMAHNIADLRYELCLAIMRTSQQEAVDG